MSPPVPGRARALLCLALLVQLVVLYLPTAPTAGGVAGADKVVHAAVFAAVAVAAVRCGYRPALVLLASAAHAVVSELAQAALLSSRSGDPLDVLADLVGAGLGVLFGRAAGHHG